jgi:hypothetical protein
MSKKSKPAAPDPLAVANAQADANLKAAQQTQANALQSAQQQAQLNRVNQTNAAGSLAYSQDPNNPNQWSANYSLTPGVQSAFNSNLGQTTANPQGVTDSLLQRLQPIQDRNKQLLDAQLANQGIGLGSEASNAAYDNYNRGINDQNLAAIQTGDQMATTDANAATQRLQALFGLGSGNFVNVPGVNVGAATVGAPDLTSTYNNNYSNAVQMYGANQGAAGAGLGALGSGLGSFFGSSVKGGGSVAGGLFQSLGLLA